MLSHVTTDRRVRRTHAALQRALIDLVEGRELGQLSVADVAEQAGVSRSTFYDHYRDVHELAEAACTTMIDDLMATLPTLGTQSLVAFFANLADHAGLYRSLLGPQGSARVIDHVRRRTAATIHWAMTDPSTESIDIPHDVPAVFVAGALIGVAIDWLQRGRPHTPAEMAALTWPLLTACHTSSPTCGL